MLRQEPRRFPVVDELVAVLVATVGGMAGVFLMAALSDITGCPSLSFAVLFFAGTVAVVVLLGQLKRSGDRAEAKWQEWSRERDRHEELVADLRQKEIAGAVAKALAHEREACAVAVQFEAMAWHEDVTDREVVAHAAEAIRARGRQSERTAAP